MLIARIVFNFQQVGEAGEIGDRIAQATNIVTENPAAAQKNGCNYQEQRKIDGLHLTRRYEALTTATTANTSREGGVSLYSNLLQ